MRLPKIRAAGDDAAIVDITGDPRNQEPDIVLVRFPGAEVEVARAGDGAGVDYWCHLRLVRPGDAAVVTDGRRLGRVVDGRMDVDGKHVDRDDAGALRHPDLHHLAVRVAVAP